MYICVCIYDVYILPYIHTYTNVYTRYIYVYYMDMDMDMYMAMDMDMYIPDNRYVWYGM